MAGFFDGEGTCGIKQVKRPNSIGHSAYVTVSQVRPEVLHWMQSCFGGSIMFKQPRGLMKNGIWAWQISCKKAMSFLQAVLPHLRVKKLEAELVLAAFEKRTKIKKLGIPAEIVEIREGARIRLMGMR
jgi:hypothetical protein